jgi:hypothetical protein
MSSDHNQRYSSSPSSPLHLAFGDFGPDLRTAFNVSHVLAWIVGPETLSFGHHRYILRSGRPSCGNELANDCAGRGYRVTLKGGSMLKHKRNTVTASKISEWLDTYMADAHVPTDNDFQKLRGELSKRQKQYEEIYRPIRNKIFVHKDADWIYKF